MGLKREAEILTSTNSDEVSLQAHRGCVKKVDVELHLQGYWDTVLSSTRWNGEASYMEDYVRSRDAQHGIWRVLGAGESPRSL